MSKSYCYCADVETTGRDPEKNDVIEIAICRLSFDEDGSHTSEIKSWCLKPINLKEIEDEALAINHHKKEDLLHQTKFGKETYREPADVVSEIELWIMEDDVSSVDRIFAGQNPNFDIGFLKSLWKKVGTPSTFPFALENGSRVIDTIQIATLIDLCVGKRRLFYNLGSLVKSFGVKKIKSHRADTDTIMTSDLLIKMISPIRPVIVDNFKNCYLEKSEDTL